MIDTQQRLDALDANNSFIVQAPAGSGKTELLTQRFLVLLTTVKQPEEIIALTFTRKAASEMRQRIMQALDNAQLPEPELAHSKQTWKLASQVLHHARQLEWNLSENPNRLRIMTIDALCASLTHQMPILSNFGAHPDVTDNPYPYYTAAVRRLLSSIEDETPWSESLSYLLLHLDNNIERAENLLIDMLQKREQWLPYIMQVKQIADLRDIFDRNLQQIIAQSLQSVHVAIPEHLSEEIVALSNIAANYLDSQKASSMITQCFGLQQLPTVSAAALPLWQAIAELLLTDKGTWRIQINKKIGFPAVSDFKNAEEKQFYKTAKQRMENLLQQLRDNDVLRINLHNVRDCPPANYTDQQWQCIEALLRVLPLLVAHLTVIFREQGAVDFSEVAQQALHALGDEENVTDLSLALDYRIQHLLIDEFQDTSLIQFRLLEKLTMSWQHGDGRSLFVVGDPMQSIYRFRAAEVGLFLKAQQQGIGHIKLKSLQLSANFRSQEGIVAWVNHSFAAIFPATTNIRLGAVPYHPSHAVIAKKEQPAVSCHAHATSQSQAQHIIDIIQQSSGNIAILVRARSHLHDIAHALKNAAISYQAVEIEALSERAIIQDLWALTRALLYRTDRLAWFSVLRAPWCGLTLQDLHALAQPLNEEILWGRIANPQILERLTEDGRTRLSLFIRAMTPAMERCQRQSLRELVETTWLSLGGPACVEQSQNLDDAAAYFSLLEQQEQGGTLIDKQQFEKKLQRLYAVDAQTNQPRVQLMTIHKAKGLEFDTVIIPALERGAPYDAAALLLWSERPAAEGNQLLLAPITAKSQDSDAIYQFMRRENNSKARYELTRLFYVAVTRAKEQLHLLASVEKNAEGEWAKPQNSSFLSALWENLKSEFVFHHEQLSIVQQHDKMYVTKRLSINWHSSSIFSDVSSSDTRQNAVPLQGFLWSHPEAAAIGTFIHRQLCFLSQGDKTPTIDEAIARLKSYGFAALQQLGVLPKNFPAALQQAELALKMMLEDERGQWILSSGHQQAYSEYPITAVSNGEIKQVIIDRTFIDDQNVRWVIDYKTSCAKPNENVADFLQREVQNYRGQLQQYAAILNLKAPHVTRCALYFPLHAAWVEVV